MAITEADDPQLFRMFSDAKALLADMWARSTSSPGHFMLQHRELRERCGCILAFQNGSFFEFIGEDAPIVADLLNVALGCWYDPATGENVPACGIPAGQGLWGLGQVTCLTGPAAYFEALTRAGHCFAIAVQVPTDAGRVVRQIIARVDASGEVWRPTLDA